ncbi:MAG TPA: helix-turn-helix transcriptional regulator [Syntrophales bacterium]|nr:helix-turn-helix transcriptional regulator [Syntrophales bacterium]HPI58071.1 helix-turn-helix transcriptional regulator [Syntrophales bacterium]HPN25287.1 helix-turn-helix transcriptional regulator [Syntrophales bacterium]HQM29294.1 helix-turn-helix transcriptional regulator [Syntrophales bacterium]
MKEWRKKYGYSQKELAEALKVTNVTVCRWETGERKIPSFLQFALGYFELQAEKPVRKIIKRKGVRK